MEKSPAQIVFSDVIMPLHDGFWLAKRAPRALARHGRSSPSAAPWKMETVVKMRTVGAIDYVTKPIGREMLHQALERALARLPVP